MSPQGEKQSVYSMDEEEREEERRQLPMGPTEQFAESNVWLQLR